MSLYEGAVCSLTPQAPEALLERVLGEFDSCGSFTCPRAVVRLSCAPLDSTCKTGYSLIIVITEKVGSLKL